MLKRSGLHVCIYALEGSLYGASGISKGEIFTMDCWGNELSYYWYFRQYEVNGYTTLQKSFSTFEDVMKSLQVDFYD